MKHKKLTREEYKVRFDDFMNKFYYIPQKDEEFRQCSYPHPDYWFISNKGYIFSAARLNVKIIKPCFCETGVKNKDGERTGITWKYGAYRDEHNRTWNMDKMIAEYFLENQFEFAEKTEVHHIKKRLSFDKNAPQDCNRADNLQILPKSVHTELTKYASKTFDEDRAVERKAAAESYPTYVTDQQTLNQLASRLLSNLQGVTLIKSVSDNPAEIEAAAHPNAAMNFKFKNE